MAESLFVRVRRIVSASVEDAVDTMERAGGACVMREAIREVDRATDEVRAGHDEAAARRLQAARQQRMFRGQIAALDEKARFAIAEGRSDLAEVALFRQFDFEAQTERLVTMQAEAAGEADRLERCLAALTARRSQMEDALAAFESAQKETQLGGEGPVRPERRTERRVERAEDAFDRAMTGAGGIAGIGRADVRTAAGIAEIATFQKSAVIARRMAALRADRDDAGGAMGRP